MAGRTAHPWFYAAKNTWYIWDGDRKVSLGVKGEENKAEALKAWHSLMANGKPTPEPTAEAKPEARTVAELIAAFLTDAEARLNPDTVKVYKGWLRPFSAQHGDGKADRLTNALAEAYSRKPEWTQSSRHSFLVTLSVAFRWAERTGLLESNPLRYLSKPPMESRGDKSLVSDEDHAKLHTAAPVYVKPFLLLLHLTGARPGEVASITAENFDEANALVRLKEHKTARKTGKPRLIFLCPEAVAILREQKAKHGTGHLFRNHRGSPWTKNAIVHLFARLRDKTGVEATAYFYRHSFATDALANGVPDAQVAALMGHAGTTMLHRHYAHLTAQAQALRDALDKIR